MLLVACIFPIFCGIGLLFYNKNTNRKLLWGTALTQVLLTAGLFATAAYENLGKTCELFSLSGQIEIVLKPDLAGLLFAVLALVVFGCAFVFSYESKMINGRMEKIPVQHKNSEYMLNAIYSMLNVAMNKSPEL